MKEQKDNKIAVISKIAIILFYITLMILCISSIYLIKTIIDIKIMELGVEGYKAMMDEKNSDYIIEWFYQCPSYVSAHYNCDNELKYQNISGKYCNGTLVCENEYIIHLKNETI